MRNGSGACSRLSASPARSARALACFVSVAIPGALRPLIPRIDKQLGALLAEYASIPITDSLHPALLKFATSTLTAGDMALWMAHGRKVFDRSWERPLLGIELTGALSDMSWGAWKQVALPHVSSNTHKLLESHPTQALELLAGLNRQKRLVDMDIVWKQRLQAWVDQTFSFWERTEDNVRLLRVLEVLKSDTPQVRMLEHVLELSKLLPSLTTILVNVVERTLSADDTRSEYDDTYANSAWIIGACSEAIAERPAGEWADLIDLPKWTTAVVEKWGWSGRALEGFVPLVRARSVQTDPCSCFTHSQCLSSRSKDIRIPLDALLDTLKPSLLSHSRSLRLNTLRLLTSPLVDPPEGTADMLKKTLQAEEISIDVQGARERVLRIGRLPLVVKDGDTVAADICARWLIGMRQGTCLRSS